MLDTLIAMGVACLVFFLFLLVFFRKDVRERTTGRRSGCQSHDPAGGCGHCQGQIAKEAPTTPVIAPEKRDAT
jgi:hypothetical protein